jgi:hypothetical protein
MWTIATGGANRLLNPIAAGDEHPVAFAYM